MCEAARQLADGLHFLRLPQLRLDEDFFSEVAHENIESHAIIDHQYADAQLHDELLPFARDSLNLPAATGRQGAAQGRWQILGKSDPVIDSHYEVDQPASHGFLARPT